MALSNKFGSKVLKGVNYDFVDLITGKAYATLYAGATLSGANVMRTHVFDSSYVSNGWYSPWIIANSVDKDFDIEVGKTLRLGGEAIVNGTIAIYNNGVAMNCNYTTTATLSKWDGTTETPIATTTNPAVNITGTTFAEHRFGVSLTIPYNTIIKKGIDLRLTIQITITGTAGTTCFLGHDPGNRTVANIINDDSTLKLFLPMLTN